MSSSSTRQPTNWYRSGVSASLLITVLALGLIGFLPSGVIDLREQESIFPLVGIAVFLAGMIFFEASKAAGFALLFVVVHVLTVFSPGSYKFLIVATLYFAMFYVIVTRYDRKYEPLIFNVICIIALLNVLWIALQVNHIYYLLYPLPQYGGIETGFFANRNEVSVFLAGTLPFFFRGKWNYGIPVIFAGLIMAQTTTGFIAASLVMAIYGIYLLRGNWKRIMSVMVIVIALSGVYLFMQNVHFGAITLRVQAWQKASELFVDKPVWGWGISQGQYVIPLYLNGDKQDKRYLAYAYSKVVFYDDFKKIYLANPKRFLDGNQIWNKLHSDPLQWAIETGLSGLAVVGLFVISLAMVFFKTRTRSICTGLSVLALLVTSGAFFTFHIGRFIFLAVLMCGLIYGRYTSQEKNGEK